MKSTLLTAAAILAAGSISAFAIPNVGRLNATASTSVDVREDDGLNIGVDEASELYSPSDLQALEQMDEYYRATNYADTENDALVWNASTNSKPKPLKKKTEKSTAKEKSVAKSEEKKPAKKTEERAHHVVINISTKSQTMIVTVNNEPRYSWKVTTGMKTLGPTPKGTFTPFEMNKNYFSRRFQVILPYGIKFQGGNLIHAASRGGMYWLGKPHSHGCVRLAPANAARLFALVHQAGMKNTRVIVH